MAKQALCYKCGGVITVVNGTFIDHVNNSAKRAGVEPQRCEGSQKIPTILEAVRYKSMGDSARLGRR